MTSNTDNVRPFRFALIVLVTGLATAAVVLITKFSLGLWTETLKRPGPVDPDLTTSIELAGETFVVPANMVVQDDSQTEAEAVELAVLWPGLEGRTAENRDQFDVPGDFPNIIRLRIDARSVFIDPDERFERILQPAFTTDRPNAPGSLQARGFKTGTGFGTDILYFDTRSGSDRYLAFCSQAFDADPPSKTAFCQREIPFGDTLRLELRFRPGLMTDWQAVDTQILNMVDGFRREQ